MLRERERERERERLFLKKEESREKEKGGGISESFWRVVLRHPLWFGLTRFGWI